MYRSGVFSEWQQIIFKIIAKIIKPNEPLISRMINSIFSVAKKIEEKDMLLIYRFFTYMLSNEPEEKRDFLLLSKCKFNLY